MRSPSLRPAVFVDKDGTLIEDVPYNVDPAKLRFQPGAPESLRALAASGYAIVVATNQSGLALKLFTRAELRRLQSALEARLLAEAGVELLDFVVCPHAPGARGEPACLCRKPAPGMLLRAARAHGIDLERSWMIGDTIEDVEAGRRAGCRAVLFRPPRGSAPLKALDPVRAASPLRHANASCVDWDEVVHTIVAAADPPPVARPLAAPPVALAPEGWP